jgi:antitoxin (DNA-binding transcriptional repressor) of toxin-antitoxin stability system
LYDFTMKTMTVTEAARHFSELISCVHYRGESAMLIKGGKPMAKVMPALRPKTGRDLAAIWGRLPHLCLKEAAAFGQDIEDSRLNLPPLVTKWD